MEENDYLRILAEMQSIVMRLQERVHKLDERVSEIEQANEETACDEMASEILKDLKTPMTLKTNMNNKPDPVIETDALMYQYQ